MPQLEDLDSPYECGQDAHCLMMLTEWNEFKELDLPRLRESMTQPIIVDGRNIYDPARLRALGFTYISVGRSDGANRPCETVAQERSRVTL